MSDKTEPTEGPAGPTAAASTVVEFVCTTPCYRGGELLDAGDKVRMDISKELPSITWRWPSGEQVKISIDKDGKKTLHQPPPQGSLARAVSPAPAPKGGGKRLADS